VKHARHVVPPELDGWRLDKALAALEPELGRERLKGIVLAGGVQLGGQPAPRPSQTVRAGDQIELDASWAPSPRPGAPAGLEFRVLHEDEHVIVLDKPAGMVAHPSATVRGGTVSELVAERYGALPAPQGADRPGLVHRLDADTSGLLLVARSELASTELMRQFREREVRKTYLALVHGDPRFDSDWIERPLSRSARHEGRVQVQPEGEGRPASTFYRVLERYGCAALLAVEPHTGRTHQIRAHLESVELPLVADRLYRGRARATLPSGLPPLERQALHAWQLEFTHPASAAALRFEAPPPADFSALRDALRARAAAALIDTPAPRERDVQ
jgi:23S rRNA pseudouridine1911/1915/1917 synthase